MLGDARRCLRMLGCQLADNLPSLFLPSGFGGDCGLERAHLAEFFFALLRGHLLDDCAPQHSVRVGPRPWRRIFLLLIYPVGRYFQRGLYRRVIVIEQPDRELTGMWCLAQFQCCPEIEQCLFLFLYQYSLIVHWISHFSSNFHRVGLARAPTVGRTTSSTR